ncbi:MAG: hypothetical protein HY369_03160 [Candidatus Aenigmarchaeota archaeon]|nr:hypothetical protein [Candidatus Aenigmarchaeota archaeon]
MHFYESMAVTTKDGMQFKTYANEHPEGFVIAKPKYIPRAGISSDSFQKRDLDGVPVNRFDYWAASEQELRQYIEHFRKLYPYYFHDSPLHQRWFFGVPKTRIASYQDPKKGVQDLVRLPSEDLDTYSLRTQDFLNILHDHGLPYSAMGITNSTLLGNYTHGRSDIDIMVFGKENYWTFFDFIRDVRHPLLRWRTVEEWQKYFASYNAGLNFSEQEFIWHAQRKRGDGLFDNNVFSVFCVEEPGETAVPWGTERYTPVGTATVKGVVGDHFHSIVRPGFYGLDNSTVVQGLDVPVRQVVTFARDFMAQAFHGETLLAHGVLEKVTPVSGEEYYRVVVGYFDSYFTNRGTEFIKVKRDGP